ncbi:LbetaH domain-containing protein [Algoriphagus chordae]|uniref:Serine O-acetyltransferase n=1 Tax=Algoriphagus chordae TaxID=237019 RepID=A0A2W7RL83_9BACT|nr:serine acetyltransferase [Algoriphagus chordae]PZX51435.1 serine O-acetyltransferase [Algoriphagus chordae]
MGQQFKYFGQDLKRMLGKYKIRILHIWLSRAFWGIFLYRLERSLFLLMGRPYEIIRVIFIPIYNLLQAYSNMDLNYKSDIKGGLLVLHPAMGVVVSGYAIIGENLTLTGGNVIGGKAGCGPGDIQVGNNCEMGANAVIIGPLKLGNSINIGASACVIRDCLEDNALLIGVPAKVLSQRKAEQ